MGVSWNTTLSGYSGNSAATTASSAQAKKLGTKFMVGNSSWEPQRTNNFELIVEGLNRITLASGEVFTSSDAMDRIMLSVDSFTAPSLEISQITTHYANNSVKWAGKPEFSNSSLVVNDYIGVQVEEILGAWFRAAYDFESEKVGLAINYKKTAYLVEYNPQGGDPRIWKLEGCWLANFNLGEWSQEGNQQRKINATFVYDRVTPFYFYNSGGIKINSAGTEDSENTGYTSSIFTNSTNS